MVKLQRYLWPKTLLLFYTNENALEVAFGYIEKDSVVIEVRRTFEGKEREQELAKWYNEILQTYPKTYLVTMLDTVNQGAIFGCSKQELEKFNIESSLTHTICIEDSWLAYVSFVEIKWFEKRHKLLSLDFIFSPFVLVYEKIKPNLTNTPVLTVLHHKGVLYIAVFSNEGLWFSQTLTILEDSLDDDVVEGKETSEDDDFGMEFDLDNVDADMDSVDDIDTLDEFKDESTEEESSDTDEGTGLGLLEQDLNFFNKLKSSIESFYHDDKYKHDFLEGIFIYDIDSKIGKDVVNYIQEELLINCSLQAFDPIDLMSSLACNDLKGFK